MNIYIIRRCRTRNLKFTVNLGVVSSNPGGGEVSLEQRNCPTSAQKRTALCGDYCDNQRLRGDPNRTSMLMWKASRAVDIGITDILWLSAAETSSLHLSRHVLADARHLLVLRESATNHLQYVSSTSNIIASSYS